MMHGAVRRAACTRLSAASNSSASASASAAFSIGPHQHLHLPAPAAVATATAATPTSPTTRCIRSYTSRAVVSGAAAAAAVATPSSAAASTSPFHLAAPILPPPSLNVAVTRKNLPDWAEPARPRIIALGNLAPRPGNKKKKRVGRGPGSGLGKTSGKGHKGQGQRKGTRKRGYEGGTTPFWRRMPKIGMNTHKRYYKMYTPVTIGRIMQFIKEGRIDGSQLITMRTLYDSGCVTKIEHGVKLLSGGLKSSELSSLRHPLHIQLSDVSVEAREALEGSGGSVHLVWFNKTTLRAHLRPLQFLRKYGRLPKATGVPPPKKAHKYGFHIEHVQY